jgi:hypothetical protein
MIETMCNEILGNYTKNEDQLMSAAFGTRPKRRLNRVMDALKLNTLIMSGSTRVPKGQKEKELLAF